MSDTSNTPPAEPRRQLVTDNDKLVTAVAAACRDVMRGEDVSAFVPDPLNSTRVWFTLTYADEAVAAAIASYPDLAVHVSDYESAAQLVRSVMIAAKRRAHALPSTAVQQRRRVQLEAERRGWQVRLNAVSRAQHVGRAPAEDNGDAEAEQDEGAEA